MSELPPLPPGYPATRGALHHVAVHVLARRRQDLTGRFGLRATSGGIGTPACGPEHEVVRTSGTRLLRERTGDRASTVSLDLDGATLAAVADLVEVDLHRPLDVGHDTPPLPPVDEPLRVDAASAEVLAAWYAFAWTVLDGVVAELGPAAEPSVLQLWPEHFDVGCDIAVPAGRANLGASPGDAFHPAPYLYVGPWGTERPGPEELWNAPFGAVLGYEELSRDGREQGRQHLVRLCALLGRSDGER